MPKKSKAKVKIKVITKAQKQAREAKIERDIRESPEVVAHRLYHGWR